MFFSIIIPTYNRNETLELCLEQLKPGNQIFSEEEYEVIVSDDGNEAKELIKNKYSWVKWEAGPKKGPAANRNHGTSKAIGKWIVFTDDDCVPTDRWLNGYWEAIKANTDVMAMEGTTIGNREPKRYNESAPINTTGGCFWSCNIAIRKEFFLELGGFDERFPYACMEDVVLREIIKSKKVQIIYAYNAIVMHPLKLETFLYIKKSGIIRYRSLLLYKIYFPDLAANINSTYFVKASLFRIYYSLKNVIKFRMKGYWIIVYQSYEDILRAINISKDLKKIKETIL